MDVIQERHVPSPGVLVRDFVIFYIKLLMDGLKDVLLLQLALLAFCLDMILVVFARSRKSRFFYSVLAMSERADLWLNLHGAARGAGQNPDGLFGESRAGDDTLLGELEELVRKEREPVRAEPARAGRPSPGMHRA